jgi:YbbR domain-containing protein
MREMDEERGRWPRLSLSGAQGWLREIFLEDLKLKLLALAITLGLWYGVTGQRTPTTIRFSGVHLTFHLPNEMELSNDPRSEVDVTLTGTRRALERINARDLVATVDLADFKPGLRSLKLTDRTVHLNLPPDVRVDDIEPNAVSLRLEPRIERQLDVEVKTEGKLPEGYELRRTLVTPSKVRVRGPASRVNLLQVAPTEPIQLDGHKESFTEQQVAVEIDDQKVDLVETVVGVALEIGEQQLEKSFQGVSVRAGEGLGPTRAPSSTSVTLYGDRSALENLKAKDIQLLLEAKPDGTTAPKLLLPPELEGRIQLRSTSLNLK